MALKIYNKLFMHPALKFNPQTFIAPFLLVFFTAVVSYTNYAPNTFLTGWDTLHPEFNLSLYLERIFFSVWQEHQALGSVASQAHASELSRFPLLVIFKLLLGVDKVRYAYIFTMLILGPLGVYKFVSRIFMKQYTIFLQETAGLFAGFFYLFNLATVQQFYVPLEMFPTHYAFLGWSLYYLASYYENPGRKGLIKFSIVVFLASCQAHTPTLFYAYMLILGLFSFGYWVRSITFNRLFIIILPLFLAFVVNLYWLLPHFYFLVNHSGKISTSKIHSLFSEEAFLQNKEFGNLADAAILKNFLFNWGEHVGNKVYGDLLDEWKVHLTRPYVLLLGYSYFALVSLGLVISLLRRERYVYSIMFVFVASLFFIFTDNPPFGVLFSELQRLLPVFKEALRFPFTKFSISLAFTYAVFFGYGITMVAEFIARLIRNKTATAILGFVFYTTLFFSQFYYALPMFFGRLVSPSMRVDIPDRYFEMFDWLNAQESYGRVANFPLQTFWGWQYYDWSTLDDKGYQGAGFLWFGIKQPLMDREFDRWNVTNENYYREMSTAIYSEDLQAIERTLEKYKIRWVLYDKSIIVPSADPKSLFYSQIDTVLKNSDKLALRQNWDNLLYVYEYTPDDDKSFSDTYIKESFAMVGDDLASDYSDPIYALYGDYVKVGQGKFPFVGLTTTKEDVSADFIKTAAQKVYLKGDVPLKNNVATFSPVPADLALFAVSAGDFINLYLVDVRSSIDEETDPFSVEAVSPARLLLSMGKSQFEDGLLEYKGTYYDISQLAGESAVLLGIVRPKDNSELVFNLYEPSSSAPLSDYTLFSSKLFRCGAVGDDTSYSISYYDNGITLESEGINACVAYPLNRLLTTTGLSLVSDLLSQANGTRVLSVTDKAPEVVMAVKADVKVTSASQLAGTRFPQAYICLLNRRTGLCDNSIHSKSHTVIFDPELIKEEEYDLMLKLVGSTTKSLIRSDFKDVHLQKYVKVTQFTSALGQPFVFSGESPTELVFYKEPGFYGEAGKLITEPRLCNGTSKDGIYSNVTTDDSGTVRFESIGESLCASIEFPSLSHNTGYILEVESQNITGLPLRLCLTNEYSKRCDLYVSLGMNKDSTRQFYLIPPYNKGQGYTLNFANLVFGEGISINNLAYVSITPFDFTKIRNIHGTVGTATGDTLLVKNEAYENGWVAICGFYLCSAEHVWVNNWANGWIFKDPKIASNAKIIFWPEILELIGMALSLGMFFVLMWKRGQRSSDKSLRYKNSEETKSV